VKESEVALLTGTPQQLDEIFCILGTETEVITSTRGGTEVYKTLFHDEEKGYKIH
jgi:hypothetical protein